MIRQWRVSHETITPESAEVGSVADSGMEGSYSSLREAIEDWGGMGCYVESDICPIRIDTPPRWFTAYQTNDGTRNFYETGETENRSLHIPDHITPASRIRLAKLIGCYGIRFGLDSWNRGG